MNRDLVNAYRAERQGRYYTQAHRAVHRARAALARGDRPYLRGATGMGAEFSHARRTCRTISGNAADLGFRVFDAADLVRMDHTGWYSRAYDFGETYAGVVLLLRTPRGTLVYSGYRESESDVIIVDTAPEDCIAGSYDTERGGSLRDAALAADRFAEVAAEESREYDSAWRAGVAYADNVTEVKTLRQRARDIVRGMRDCHIGSPAVCEALRREVRGIRSEVRGLLEQCRSLAAGEGASTRDHWRQFWSDDRRLREAFNDGAGAGVLQ